MSTQDPTPGSKQPEHSYEAEQSDTASFEPASVDTEVSEPEPTFRVGTIVWGLVVLALAVLIIISKLGIVALNGTYVLIGLMLGAGAALVVGGLLSMRNKGNSGSGSGNTAIGK
ncbi:hypothetical protein [Arthrobacter sp. ISL-30]|uniref:hypothetical protein n=1 Tax=Arthrobacter sp. ISL-30 TaxID=2819109 RepID=UPI00203592F3|nr:hypothetical protein [Arthrobacter sp. ISL-30]